MGSQAAAYRHRHDTDAHSHRHKRTHTHAWAHGGAARPCGYGMLITVSYTKALAWGRGHLREGAGSSPFSGARAMQRVPSH